MSGKRKYECAYDSKLHKIVKPEEVAICDRYDKPRYYSVNEENNNMPGNMILTMRKETVDIPYKKPELHDKETYKRKLCFVALCANTVENNNKLRAQTKHQESLVHKLAKSIAKTVEYIKIPELKFNILGIERTLIKEQYIKVRYLRSETKDAETGVIPDIVFETEYNGFKEELQLEIYYKHRVEELKKEILKKNKINCLEVDVSNIVSNLDISDNSIQKIITNAIRENAYWISNAYIENYNEIYKNYILELNAQNFITLSIQRAYLADPDHRYYTFKRDLERYSTFCKQDPKDNLYDDRYIHIGQCKRCKNCLAIYGYGKDKLEDIHVYCFLHHELEKNDFINIVSILDNISNEALDKCKNKIINNTNTECKKEQINDDVEVKQTINNINNEAVEVIGHIDIDKIKEYKN